MKQPPNLNNDEIDYDELIYSWYQKASAEDYFSKFVFLYMAFSAFLRKKRFPECAKDREAIEKLKKDSEIKDKFYEFYVKCDRQMVVQIEALIRELKKQPLKNETDGRTNMVVINSIEDWGNIIEFLYIVRNNLFHGEKSPEAFRDSVMVYYAYKLLTPIVEVMVGMIDMGRLGLRMNKLKEYEKKLIQEEKDAKNKIQTN